MRLQAKTEKKGYFNVLLMKEVHKATMDDMLSIHSYISWKLKMQHLIYTKARDYS